MRARILVVEDDQVLLETLKILLEEEGYETATAKDGALGIQLATKEQFDLIICDIRMPKVGGLETIKQVRSRSPGTRAIVITGYASSDAPITAIRLGADDYLRKPFDNQELLDSIRQALQNLEQFKKGQERLESTEKGIIEILKKVSLAMDTRAQHQAGHSERVAQLAVRFGRCMGFPPERLKVLELAGILHDIGKMKVEQKLFEKPGELLESEMEKIKEHAGLSGELLNLLPNMREIVSIVIHHHEWFNGKGYPKGLSGNEIPLDSRILAVADAFESLTHPRSYREAKLPEEARKIIIEASGTQFDPEIVNFMDKVLEEGEPLVEPADIVESGITTQSQRIFLNFMGETYRKLDQYSLAVDAYKESLKLDTTNDHVSFETCLGLARIYIYIGKRVLAKDFADKALSIGEKVNSLLKAKALTVLGYLLGEEDEQATAIKTLLDAQEIFERWEFHEGLVLVYLLLSYIHSKGHMTLEWGREKFFRYLQSTLLLAKKHGQEQVLINESELLIPVLGVAIYHHYAIEAIRPLFLKVAHRKPGAFKEFTEKLDLAVFGTLRKEFPDILETVQTTHLLQVHTLGKFQVIVNDVPIKEDDWKTKKCKYLFAYLICTAGYPVTEEKLFDIFWPDNIETARQNLHSTVYYIRKALQEYSGGKVGTEFIMHSKEFYQFNSSQPYWLDIAEFESHYQTGKRLLTEGKEKEAITEFLQAEGLYKGEFLEGYYSEWAQGYRTQLGKKIQSIYEELNRHYFKVSHYEAAISYAQKLLERDPCMQDAYMIIMRSYAAMGRPEESIKVYMQATSTLKKELNLSPSPDLMKLYLSLTS